MDAAPLPTRYVLCFVCFFVLFCGLFDCFAISCFVCLFIRYDSLFLFGYQHFHNRTQSRVMTQITVKHIFSRGSFFRVFAQINIRLLLIFALLHTINSILLTIYSTKNYFRALVVYREKREN